MSPKPINGTRLRFHLLKVQLVRQFISFAAVVVYFTYNDQPSGVYASQVCDVVEFISAHREEKVRLVALISLRGFSHSRRKIKAQSPGAIVLPMFPKMKNWQLNVFLIWPVLLILQPRVVMARGVFATALALRAQKALRHFKLIFDARGAYHAEFSEYQPGGWPGIERTVRQLEEKALKHSDAQLAVSNALIAYWNDRYQLDKSGSAVVVPCTLSSTAHHVLPDESERNALRLKHEIKPDEVLLVYAGSAAGWQSFGGLYEWLEHMLKNQPAVKVMLMTPLKSLDGTPLAAFASRVKLKWVAPDEVRKYLAMGDYGLLLREISDTNRVASPTKFAEYLAAGLRVLVSPNLGDFSDFVSAQQCGEVVSAGEFPQLPVTERSEAIKLNQLANQYFTKNRFKSAYNRLLT